MRFKFKEVEKRMADSNITKRALANALKELMQEKLFEKISVSDICERCDMNRKSFYYHFKDKYDLVNWIFDTEFIMVMKDKGDEDTWKWYTDICDYFYNNKSFYKKALLITGQNSFSDHFREVLYRIITKRFGEVFGISDLNEFQINFFTDAVVVAFHRWLMDDNTMTSQEFVEEIKTCLCYMAMRYDAFEK